MFEKLLHLLLTSIALLTGPLVCAQFNEDFEDENLAVAPPWEGDLGLFTTADQGGNKLLRSNSPGAATYYLSTPSILASDARWEWFMDLRFATSGANYVDVYLMSDNPVMTATQNGWFVRVGGTQDRVELFKRVAGTNSSVLVSPDGIVNSSSSNPFRIRVERTLTNAWTLLYDDGNTGNYMGVGPVTDAAVGTSAHFGLLIVQSTAASVVNNHFFDDIAVGNIPVDLSPPVLLSASVFSDMQVDLLFNESLAAFSVGALGNYSVTGGLTVTAATLNGPATVRLTLSPAMQNNETYTATVNGVEDLVGNASIDQQIDFSLIVPEEAFLRDVVINEFMADPSPAVALPDAEFVELFNTTSNKTFDLAGWKFTDGSSTATLPSYALGPGQYVIITSSASSAQFAFVANRISVSSLPTLNNDADNLALTAPDNTLIDAVSYALSWYRDSNKQEGGWTLEQINPYAACSGAANWIASMAAVGGTPGLPNSVLDPTPDTTPPTIAAALVGGEQEVDLLFSEAMDVASLLSGTYAFDPFLAVVQVTTSTADRVRLTVGSPIAPGTIYTATVIGVTDCTGNPIPAGSSITFALPEPIAPGDLVINEVLYDPMDTGSDFVELFNRSNKTLSLAGLQMANVTSGAIGNYRVITSEALLLLPGEYILLTPNPVDIATRYPQSRTDRFLTMSLPNYVNTRGTVILADATNTILDRFDYDDKLHFALVRSPEGYSLERVDPDRPSNDATNWQTASDNAGRATPGFRNSQFAQSPEPRGEMTIEPAIFSPDNDGYQDLLTIGYRFNMDGFVGNMTVFDVAGREARRLMENQLLGTSGAISWNGMMDNGSMGRMGPYIIYFEVFDLVGNVEKYRKTVTLAHRLD